LLDREILMSFRQYTQCVDIENFDPTDPRVQATKLGLYVSLPPAVFTALLLAFGGIGSGWCYFLLLEVWAIAFIVGITYWALYRKLVCIPAPPGHPADSAGDHLAIGLLINIEPPGSGSFTDNIDNDYSIGILPCPLQPPADLTQVVQHSPFAYLVEEQPVTMDRGLRYAGEQALCPGSPPNSKRSEVLHCEFEGRGLYDMYLAARVALMLAVAAFVLCFFPVAGWIVAILAFLAALGIGVGLGIGQFDQGDPNDVNPNVGQLSQCVDTLVIKGHWVYDSGHSGAYELHPVTFCCKANCDSKDISLLGLRWEVAIADITSPATLAGQKQPQNQWRVHPLIDGCQPPIV
jgi:hypothetical protein